MGLTTKGKDDDVDDKKKNDQTRMAMKVESKKDKGSRKVDDDDADDDVGAVQVLTRSTKESFESKEKHRRFGQQKKGEKKTKKCSLSTKGK